MDSTAKSGPEIVDEFFLSLKGREDLNAGVVSVLLELREAGKFTPTHISNALEQLRKRELNG
jgi:hypothetical protein